MPLCLGASGSVRASVKMWSARWPADVQIFWPLSTHWSPSSVGPQRQAAEVGAGVGLGVALAPRVLAGQDPRQVVRLLLVGAPHEQRVAEHLDAEHVVGATGRHAGLGELLGDDHLLERRQPAAAVLHRPAGRQVAGLVQHVRHHSTNSRTSSPSSVRCPPSRSAASRRGTPGPCRGRPRPRAVRRVHRTADHATGGARPAQLPAGQRRRRRRAGLAARAR